MGQGAPDARLPVQATHCDEKTFSSAAETTGAPATQVATEDEQPPTIFLPAPDVTLLTKAATGNERALSAATEAAAAVQLLPEVLIPQQVSCDH